MPTAGRAGAGQREESNVEANAARRRGHVVLVSRPFGHSGHGRVQLLRAESPSRIFSL